MKTFLRRIKMDPEVVWQYCLHHEKNKFLCRNTGQWFVSKLEVGDPEELGLAKNCPVGVMYVTRDIAGGLSVVLDALSLDELCLLHMR